MADALKTYVLDSFALFAYIQAENAGPVVQGLLENARDNQLMLALSMINLGEVYYVIYREKGEVRAEEILKDLRELPIQLYAATDERVLAAARIKANHPVSYADAFAAGLAQELGATLVTGDPEFKSVESMVDLFWLQNKSSKP